MFAKPRVARSSRVQPTSHAWVVVVAACQIAAALGLHGVAGAEGGDGDAGGGPRPGEFFATDAADATAGDVRDAARLPALPARPAARVLDDARIFSDAERTALEGVLRTAWESDGLDIYVAASTFIVGESLEDRAQRLCDAWVGQPRGLVFLYLRGDHKMTLCAPGGDEPFLPQPILIRRYEAAVREGIEFERPADRIATTVGAMIGSLREALARREEMDKVFDPHVVRTLVFFAVALVLLGAAGLVLARLFSTVDRHHDIRLVFPQTPVPPRFGAPFGGGVCAEIDFARGRRA